MMKCRKKHLALLLSIILCLSLSPATAFAGEGSEDSVLEEPAEAVETTAAETAGADAVAEEDNAAAPPRTEDVAVDNDVLAETMNEPEEDTLRTAPTAAEQVEGFVRRCYNIILGREGEPGGVEYWVNALLSGQRAGAEIISEFIFSDEFVAKGYSDEEVVTILYRAMMGREADEGGFAYWMSFINNGMSYRYVANGFSTSTEFGGICAGYGIQPGSVELKETRDQNPQVTAFVNRNYLYALGRKGEPEGLNDWTGKLLSNTKTPKQVAREFVFSDECIGHNLNNAAFVTMLYHLYMDREPDEGGMNYWLAELKAGKPREVVAEGFAGSNEFKAIIESYGLPAENVICAEP